MAGRTRPGPADPLTHVTPKTTLTNAVLSIGMTSEVSPYVATFARALYQGLTGQAAALQPGDRRFFFLPAYTLGLILHDSLPDEETEECQPPLPTEHKADSSKSKTKTVSTPPTRSARSRA